MARAPADLARLRRRWRGRLDRIEEDIGDLLWRRRIYRGLRDIASSKPAIANPSYLVDWLVRQYVEAIAIGLRRQLDYDSRSWSLTRMLYEFVESPGVINRMSFRKLYPVRMRDVADVHFREETGHHERLSLRSIRSDLAKLDLAGERVTRLVNKRFAHLAAPGTIRKIPLLRELDDALDVVELIYLRYRFLLNGTAQTSPEPVMQAPWEDVLTFPWISPSPGKRQ